MQLVSIKISRDSAEKMSNVERTILHRIPATGNQNEVAKY